MLITNQRLVEEFNKFIQEHIELCQQTNEIERTMDENLRPTNKYSQEFRQAVGERLKKTNQLINMVKEFVAKHEKLPDRIKPLTGIYYSDVKEVLEDCKLDLDLYKQYEQELLAGVYSRSMH